MKPKGSVMIWTIMLAMLLSTLFLFFGARLRANAAEQRDTIRIRNARTFLDSFAAYLKESAVAPTLTGLSGADKRYRTITYTLTKDVSSIPGFLDAGQSIAYSALPKTTVCWGQTGENAELMINGAPGAGGTSCTGYLKSQTVAAANLNLQALGPLHYQLLPADTAVMQDTRWHLDAVIRLEGSKSVAISEVF